MVARLTTIGIVVLVLEACSSGGPVPDDRFYELTPELAARAPDVHLKGGLSIATVSADPLRSGRAILYRDARRPQELGRYHYELWAAQPPQMIRQALLDTLRQNRVADRVESQGRRSNFRYQLDVEIRRFESLIDVNRTRADVEIEADLRVADSGDLVWTKRYRQQVDARPGDMHALAGAMEQGLELIFSQLLGDLEDAAVSND